MDRIHGLGATVTRIPTADEVSTLIPRIARLWAELATFDRDLAIELAAKLPEMEIKIES